VASLSQGRTAAAQCGLFTHKSVPVIFEPPCSSAFSHSVPQNIHQLSLMSVAAITPRITSQLVFIFMCVKWDKGFYSVEGTARLCMLQTWEPCAGNAWNSPTDSEISMTMEWTEHRLWGVEALEQRLKIWVSGRPSQVRQTNTLEKVAISSTKSHGEIRIIVCNIPANSKGRREHVADHRQVYVSVARRGKPAEICGC